MQNWKPLAALVTLGLIVGYLAARLVDPSLVDPRRASAAFSLNEEERTPPLRHPFDGFPEDPAPNGYGPRPVATTPGYWSSGLDKAGRYAESMGQGAAPDAKDAPNSYFGAEPAPAPGENDAGPVPSAADAAGEQAEAAANDAGAGAEAAGE